jgi:hypothetical protein
MKYKKKYIDGLKPIKKAYALHIGEVLHLAFDMYYRGGSDADVTKHITAYMDNIISEVDPIEQEEYTIQKYTVLGMWQNFPYKDLSLFSEIKSEQELRVPISAGVEFVCKIDRLLTLKKTGLVWLGELKSSGLPFQNFTNRVGTSPQATAYVWALRQKGINASGVLYDFIKKPLLRKGVKDNCDSYGRRILEDYKIRPDIYYGRHYEYRSDWQIKMFEKDLEYTISNIIATRNSDSFYRNQEACWHYNSECSFKKICFSETIDPLMLQLYYQPIQEKEKENGRTDESIDE